MGPGEENRGEYRAPLTNVDLRYNRLKGSIILGNYEVSHNHLCDIKLKNYYLLIRIELNYVLYIYIVVFTDTTLL